MPGMVSVVQPYVPAYRVALFRELARLLRDDDLELEILVGRLRGPQAARNDAAWVEGLRTVGSADAVVGGHHLRYRHVLRPTARSAVVVGEHASGALDSSVLLLRSSVPVVLWGHGAPFVNDGSRADRAVEKWQLRRARHYLAYTDEGAASVRAARPELAVTVLRNTTDTEALSEAIGRVIPEDVMAFRRRHDLADRRLVVYVGGLDTSKHIDLLLEVAEAVHDARGDVVLVVAGDGVLAADLGRRASETTWLRYIGRAGTDELALLAVAGEFLLNPGRVGLIAVDSFATGLPLVTTTGPGHAPEFGYLHDGDNAVIVDRTAGALISACLALLDDPARVARLAERGRSALPDYNVTAMASRFRDGVLAARPGT